MKPDVILKLEQGAVPWSVEKPVKQQLSGRSAHAGQKG